MQQQYQGYPNYLHQTSQYDFYSPRLAGYNGIMHNPYGFAHSNLDFKNAPTNWFDGAKAGSFDSWALPLGIAVGIAPMFAKKGILARKKSKQAAAVAGVGLALYSIGRTIKLF